MVAEPSAEVTLDGTIERIAFHSDDSAFTVARFIGVDHSAITIVGELVGLSEGLPLRVRGQWIVDKKYGRQFRVATYQMRAP